MPSPGWLHLALSREVERLAVDAAGAGGARTFLRAVADGVADGIGDIFSTKGYRRLRAAGEIWALVGRLAPDGDVPAFLARICRRRLLPTDWLNRELRDPCLLQNPPRVVPDDRTEEQRRFPELFRHLEARPGTAGYEPGRGLPQTEARI